MRKKEFLSLMATILAIALLYSCQKDQKERDLGWNALSFTIDGSQEYNKYKDEPHINITFPSITLSGKLDYIDGIWREGGRGYSFVAHNWDSEGVIFQIYQGESLFKEIEISTSTQNSEQSTLKSLTLSQQLPPGLYHFALYALNQRERAPLILHQLHGTKNLFRVE